MPVSLDKGFATNKGHVYEETFWKSGPGSILGCTTRRRNRIRTRARNRTRNRLLSLLDYDYEYRFAENEHENRSDGLLPICTLL